MYTAGDLSFLFPFKKYIRVGWIMLLAGCLACLPGHSATRTSKAAGGNWGTAGTWVGNVVPSATDIVVIATTGTGKVTVNATTRTCAGITINAGATLVCSTIGLVVNGPWLNNGTFTRGSATVTFGSATAAINSGTGTSAFTNLALASGATLAIHDAVTASGTFTIPAAAANTRVNIGADGSLAVTGATTIARPNNGFTSTISVGDGSFSAGSLTMSATTSPRNDSLTIGNGIATITGNITNGSSGCIFRFYGTGTLNIGGTVTSAAVGFTAGTGTVNFNRANIQTIWAVTYNNLTLAGNGAKTVTGATVNGILSRQGTATVTGTPGYGSAATLEYKGSAAQTTGAEFPATWTGTGGILINNANGVTLNAAKNIGARPLTIGSTIANSLFSDGGFQLTATGVIDIVSGKFRLGSATTASSYPGFGTNTFAAGATVEYASGVAQNISVAPVYKNLVFSGNGNKTIAAGTLTVEEEWNVSGGTSLFSTNNASGNITGDITGTGAITMGSGAITLHGHWTNSGPFTPGTSSVTYNNPSGGETVRAMVYNNLVIANTSGVQTAAGDITATNFSTAAGSALDMGTNALTAANITHAGTLYTQNTSTAPIPLGKTWGGTVAFNGGSAQTIVHGNYQNLDGSGGARILSTAGVIGVAGMFTPGTGNSYTVTGSTVDFNGNSVQDIPAFNFGSLKISNGGTKRILGNIVVGCVSLGIQGSTPLSIDAQNAGKLDIQ